MEMSPVSEYQVTDHGGGRYTVQSGPGIESILALILTPIFLVWLAFQWAVAAVKPFIEPAAYLAVAAPIAVWWTRELIISIRHARLVALPLATAYFLAALVALGLQQPAEFWKTQQGILLQGAMLVWLAWLVGYIPLRFGRGLRAESVGAFFGWGALLLLDLVAVHAAAFPEERYRLTGELGRLQDVMAVLFPTAFAVGVLIGLWALIRPTAVEARTAEVAQTPSPDSVALDSTVFGDRESSLDQERRTDGMSGECGLRDHEWGGDNQVHGRTDTSWFECRRCGVGDELRFVRLGPSTLRAEIDMYPARGSATIRREVIQFLTMTCEARIKHVEAHGMLVERGQVRVNATPVGDGLGWSQADA